MPAMKTLLVLLPILRLAAGQSGTAVTALTVTASATPFTFDGASSGEAATSTVNATDGGIFTFGADSTVSGYVAPTTTVDFSIVVENGTTITLNYTASSLGGTASTAFLTSTASASNGNGNGTAGAPTATTSSKPTAGASSTNGSLPAQHTANAAVAGADGVNLGLSFLGFVGAMAAVGL